MAHAGAEGVREAGAEAVVKRVLETVPEEVARKAGFKLEQDAPVARIDELAQFDGFLFGTPTRFGNMTGQMKNFLDQAGSLWMSGALVGADGRRQPSKVELEGARYLGKHLAQIAAKLAR